MKRRGSGTPGGGGGPEFGCSPSGVLVQTIDCATIEALPFHFEWTWAQWIEFSDYYAYDHTEAGRQAAWADAVGDCPWDTPWGNLVPTGSPCDWTYTPPPPWNPYVPNPGIPHWNMQVMWIGGGVDAWEVFFYVYRFSPQLDMSSLGYSSATHQAWLKVSWDGNDYVANGVDEEWPYPYQFIEEQCYDISLALDGLHNFKDEVYVVSLAETYAAIAGFVPADVVDLEWAAGGWIIDGLSVEVYELP